MTSERIRRVPLDRLGDGALAILREEASDWLVAKADDLPKGIDDAEGARREAEEVAALGRLVAGLRQGEILMPDPVARELIARATSEDSRLGELKKEYDQELGRQESWAALLAHLDTAPGTGPADAGAEEDSGAEPESPDRPRPAASASRWVDLAGRLSDDQLRIVRKEVAGMLAGRTGDLRLLLQDPDPEREISEVAALARLSFGLARGEIEVPDPLAHEMVVGLAESCDELNEYEELRERLEAGVAEHEALRALAAIFVDAPTVPLGPEVRAADDPRPLPDQPERRLLVRVIDDFDRRVAEQLGRRVRRRRHFLYLSQEALGERTGIHRSQFSLYESGERLPSTSTLIKLAAGLGVSVEQLLVGIEWEVPGPPLRDPHVDDPHG